MTEPLKAADVRAVVQSLHGMMDNPYPSVPVSRVLTWKRCQSLCEGHRRARLMVGGTKLFGIVWGGFPICRECYQDIAGPQSADPLSHYPRSGA